MVIFHSYVSLPKVFYHEGTIFHGRTPMKNSLATGTTGATGDAGARTTGTGGTPWKVRIGVAERPPMPGTARCVWDDFMGIYPLVI